MRLRRTELVSVIDRGQPERMLVRKVVAGAAGAVAFDERDGPEVFETGTRGAERLAAAFGACCFVLQTKEIVYENKLICAYISAYICL